MSNQSTRPRYHIFRDNEFLFEDHQAAHALEIPLKALRVGDVIVPVERHSTGKFEFVKSCAILDYTREFKWHRAHKLSDQIKAWLFMTGYEYESV